MVCVSEVAQAALLQRDIYWRLLPHAGYAPCVRHQDRMTAMYRDHDAAPSV
jgi:hypothetical protein